VAVGLNGFAPLAGQLAVQHVPGVLPKTANLNQRARRCWPRAYPFAFAVVPVLHLAAANAGQWIEVGDVLLPLCLSLGAAATAYGWSALLTRDPDKRALLAALGVLVFSSYGLVAGMVSLSSAAWILGPPATALLVLLLAGTAVTVAILRSRRSFTPATPVLGLMSLLLFPWPLGQLARAKLVAHRGSSTRASAAASATAMRRPSIFLIILDKYTGSESLASYYRYDNSAFEEALRTRGFVLPSHPHANYGYTRQAMAALLNWEYLDSLAQTMGPKSRDFGPLFMMAINNRAMAFARELGYKVVYFPNRYPPFRSNPNADLQLPDPSQISIEFQDAWRERTLLGPMLEVVCEQISCEHDPWPRPSASQMDWRFEQFGPLAASTRPLFVVAHLLMPHEPYFYRADCSHNALRDFWPQDSARRALYLGQVTCVNRKVIAVVDTILRKSRTRPIILIQSDHGDATFPKEPLPLAEATPAMIRTRFDVLAAYYVPGAPDTLFYDGMTPVNLLPRVFNFLFGTRFPRLPDRSYWVTDGVPYDLPGISADLLTGSASAPAMKVGIVTPNSADPGGPSR
jgi:hypothetical protein